METPGGARLESQHTGGVETEDQKFMACLKTTKQNDIVPPLSKQTTLGVGIFLSMLSLKARKNGGHTLGHVYL